MSYYDGLQFVLNSGPYDSRTTIGNMPKDEKWVLDYRIIDANGNPVDNDFNISLGEYIYSADNYGYQELTNNIAFSKTVIDNDEEYSRIIFTVNSTNYTEETFKKNSQIHIKIKPKLVLPSYEGEKRIPVVWYIEKLAFYKKHEDVNGNIIIPDYLSDKSTAAE